MKSITIHNIETTLANQIELLAKKESISQNKLIKRLLHKALGVEEKGKNSNLLKFVNTISHEEMSTIFEDLKSVSEIDQSEW